MPPCKLQYSREFPSTKCNNQTRRIEVRCRRLIRRIRPVMTSNRLLSRALDSLKKHRPWCSPVFCLYTINGGLFDIYCQRQTAPKPSLYTVSSC
ncbi:hypothetical protein YC2023_059169 [Brassica napus]